MPKGDKIREQYAKGFKPLSFFLMYPGLNTPKLTCPVFGCDITWEAEGNVQNTLLVYTGQS